jgi:DNA modification methylase
MLSIISWQLIGWLVSPRILAAASRALSFFSPPSASAFFGCRFLDCFSVDEFYIWGGYANLGNYPPHLKAHGLYFSQAIVWDKEHPVLTRKDFMGCFELAFYGWKEGAAHQFFGPNNALDLWSIKKVNPQSMVHLTEKPVELAARAMEYSSKPGEHVLDLFGGSGSTLIAAEQTGRKAFLMELDPLYCDVIVQRFEQFTGQKAERYG